MHQGDPVLLELSRGGDLAPGQLDFRDVILTLPFLKPFRVTAGVNLGSLCMIWTFDHLFRNGCAREITISYFMITLCEHQSGQVYTLKRRLGRWTLGTSSSYAINIGGAESEEELGLRMVRVALHTRTNSSPRAGDDEKSIFQLTHIKALRIYFAST